MKWGLKGGISIDADAGPPRYVLWCCGGICHEVLPFIQIGCGHTVIFELQNHNLRQKKANFNPQFFHYCQKCGILRSHFSIQALKIIAAAFSGDWRVIFSNFDREKRFKVISFYSYPTLPSFSLNDLKKGQSVNF